MSAMNEHWKASGTDDLFLAFVIAWNVYPLLFISAAYKTFELYCRHVIPPGC